MLPVCCIGFDSAWTDSARAPGAICALDIRDDGSATFHSPRLASFEDALAFVAKLVSSDRPVLIALDQSTVVPNETGMRPVERVAASLLSWLGGGVQPSNRNRTGMFCAAALLWPFLNRLNAAEDPEAARTAPSGTYLIEVFPAIALPSLSADFCGRLRAPRYNPARGKTYRPADWLRVADVTADAFAASGFGAPADWCRSLMAIGRPVKADQDRLDAMLCLLVALRWRLASRADMLMLGTLDSGYMILPASPDVRERLTQAAARIGVPLDGIVPAQR